MIGSPFSASRRSSGVSAADGDDFIPQDDLGIRVLGHVNQVYDRCTPAGRALLGSHALTRATMPWGEIKIGTWPQDGPLVFWRTTRNRLVVADLARVGVSNCPA
ncbi:hypothetical protein GCM10018952_07820 [Streptosporangium vulgare]